MFGSSKNKPGKQEWNAFFANNVEIEGSLRFTGLLNIDGKLKGAIVAKGMLVTGTNAEIEGDVFVENLILSGSIKGNIYASGEVHLNQTAKVIGNINYNTLSIIPGAVHEGNSHLFTEEERVELLEKIKLENRNIDKAEQALPGKDKKGAAKIPPPKKSKELPVVEPVVTGPLDAGDAIPNINIAASSQSK
ncbi:MAG: polymer-forming cytoskeletal protein [Deltaproteobacteria bacterium]|jgi:cytoskeletal protein CcmA (bactofilin family)|nr:polymer-forming cytoskeletal protein [Deltaproteobacteria bacterium]